MAKRQARSRREVIMAAPAAPGLVAATGGQGPAEQWRLLRGAYDAARGLELTGERTYRLAGRAVKISVAGRRLNALLSRAVSHLVADEAAASELEIFAWDETLLCGRSPLPSWAVRGSPAQGGALYYRHNSFWACYQPDADVFCLLDLSERRALVSVGDAGALPAYEIASPLRRLFHRWLSPLGLHLVHAAAVGFNGGGALVVGAGGSGKSTCALACLGAGMTYLSDDYCLLESGGTPRVHNIYGTAKLDEAGCRRLPRLAGLLSRADIRDGDKAVIFLGESAEAALGSSVPVKAVLRPRLGAAASGLRPARPATVVAAAAPSTIFQLPGNGAEILGVLARLAGQVPCFDLDMADDPEPIPDLIRAALAP